MRPATAIGHLRRALDHKWRSPVTPKTTFALGVNDGEALWSWIGELEAENTVLWDEVMRERTRRSA